MALERCGMPAPLWLLARIPPSPDPSLKGRGTYAFPSTADSTLCGQGIGPQGREREHVR